DAFFLHPFAEPASGETVLLAVAHEDGFIAVGAFSPVTLAREAISSLFAETEHVSVLIVSATGEVIYQTGSPDAVAAIGQEQPGVIEALRGESGTTYLTV